MLARGPAPCLGLARTPAVLRRCSQSWGFFAFHDVTRAPRFTVACSGRAACWHPPPAAWHGTRDQSPRSFEDPRSSSQSEYAHAHAPARAAGKASAAGLMPPPPWRLAILAPDTHAGVKLLRLARAAALCVAQNRPLRAPSAGAGAGAVCYPLKWHARHGVCVPGNPGACCVCGTCGVLATGR